MFSTQLTCERSNCDSEIDSICVLITWTLDSDCRRPLLH